MYIDLGKLKVSPIAPEQFQQNGIDLILKEVKSGSSIWPNSVFHLGCTAETLSLPDDLMAFVELRSSWARHGVFIPPTIVDAGFSGNLTLEILSFGVDVKEAVGQRFAHLIFAKTSGPCVPYRGKYQGQEGVTGAK